MANLVVCCDGTNNSMQGDPTNVALIDRITRGVPDQYVYYDAGVGVEAAPGVWTRIGAKITQLWGSAFGSGLVENVAQAYGAMVDHYHPPVAGQPADQVFLFGFSRGAYTARVLCGLLHHYGLLKPEHRGRIGEAVDHYRNLAPRSGSPEERKRHFDRTYREAREFKAKYSIVCPVHFAGLWDTVSSLGWVYDPETFPSTAQMPGVEIVRHAMAIDERRAKFRPNRIAKGKDGKPDIKEVWFAGVHADVGGGYGDDPSLSRIAFRWILREATKAGLRLNDNAWSELDRVWLAEKDELAEQHESLAGAWWTMEQVPLPHRRLDKDKWIDERRRYGGTGWRNIEDHDYVSSSLKRRMTSKPVKNANWPRVKDSVRWED